MSPDIERRATAGVTASGRRLTGYVAVFGVETRIGDFTESIMPGAFRASLAAGKDILALLDHDPGQLLGRTRSGTLHLAEDARGLAFTLDLPDTQAGRDMVALATRGDLGGMSFGFTATDEVWHGERRQLLAVDLVEVSVVQSWPAYPQTEVSLRRRPETSHESRPLYLWLETVR